MEVKSTIMTQEIGAVTVPLVDVPTYGALLRCVSGINENHSLAKSFGLVPNEPLQLIEAPVVELPIELLAFSLLHSYLAQIFEGEHSIASVNNGLSYAMIHVSHKPSFPSAHLFELSLGGSGAFGLKFCSKLGILSSDVLHSLAIEELVVRANRYVLDASVDAKDFDITNDRWIGRLYGHMEIEVLGVSTIRQRGTLDGPSKIRQIAVRDMKGRLDSSTSGCNGSNAVNHVHSGHSLIVPHGCKKLPLRECFALLGLEGFTGAVPCSLNKAGWKTPRLPDELVRRFMVLHFVPSMVLKPPLGTGVECLRILPHCVKELGSILDGGSELEGQATYHIQMMIPLIEKYFGGLYIERNVSLEGTAPLHPSGWVSAACDWDECYPNSSHL